MLDYKIKGILLQMISYCERILQKSDNVSKEQYDSDQDLQEILCFNLIQLGELAAKLPTDFTIENNLVPWAKIKGLRNRIAHGYDSINYEIVWATVKYNVKELLDYCRVIVSEK